MTEDLLKDIDAKIDDVLSEMLAMKIQLSKLQQENAFLKSEQTSYSEKLKNLIGLLDVLHLEDVINLNENEKEKEKQENQNEDAVI